MGPDGPPPGRGLPRRCRCPSRSTEGAPTPMLSTWEADGRQLRELGRSANPQVNRLRQAVRQYRPPTARDHGLGHAQVTAPILLAEQDPEVASREAERRDAGQRACRLTAFDRQGQRFPSVAAGAEVFEPSLQGGEASIAGRTVAPSSKDVAMSVGRSPASRNPGRWWAWSGSSSGPRVTRAMSIPSSRTAALSHTVTSDRRLLLVSGGPGARTRRR